MYKLNYNDTIVTKNSEVMSFYSNNRTNQPLLFGLKSPPLFSGKMKVLTAELKSEQLQVFRGIKLLRRNGV